MKDKKQSSSKNILYINNYACDYQYYMEAKELRLPKNHLWGIYELIEDGHHIDFLHSDSLPKIKGKKNAISKLITSIKRKIFLKNILKKYKDYDVVYMAQTNFRIGEYLAKKKNKGLLNAELVVASHHPHSIIHNSSSYQNILCLSQCVIDILKYENSERLFWGPDMEYYDFWIGKFEKEMKATNEELVFISNGKSHRDNNTFLEAAKELPVKVIIVCDKTTRPAQEHFSNPNFTIIAGDIVGDTVSGEQNVKMILDSDVMVIPLNESNNHLCGLTSFVDAIGLGKPIIMSDNTFLDVDIEKEGFGFLYKVGEKEDLKKKMESFLADKNLAKKMGEKARAFGEKNNLKDVWAKRLIETIHKS